MGDEGLMDLIRATVKNNLVIMMKFFGFQYNREYGHFDSYGVNMVTMFDENTRRYEEIEDPNCYHAIAVKNFFQRPNSDVPPTPHNFLRVSRILECLGVLGMSKEQEAVMRAFVDRIIYDDNKKVYQHMILLTPWGEPDEKALWLQKLNKDVFLSIKNYILYERSRGIIVTEVSCGGCGGLIGGR